MEVSFGFCDLNIPVMQPNLKETVIQALKLGYRTIALTQEISDEISLNKKGKKKDRVPEIPLPYKFKLTPAEMKTYGLYKNPVILSRITVIFSDPSSALLHKNKDLLANYDLVAFSPTSDAAFQQVCQTNADVDIIAFSIDEMDYRLSRNLIKLAIKRDIYLEISYGPCIRSSSIRQKTIQLAHTLHQVSRSINIIMTSKAQGPEDLRNPYDVANLGLLFALTQASSKEAILSISWDTIRCAKIRRRMGGKHNNTCSAEVDSISEQVNKKTKYSSLIEIDKLIDNK